MSKNIFDPASIMNPLAQRCIAEDIGAKLSWLVAAALFHYEWDVLGYVLVGYGCLEMFGSIMLAFASSRERSR